MLEVFDISKSYKKRKVLDKVSISLKRGEIVGILGPNGAGKTTLFKVIIGLLKADSGKVILDKELVNGLQLHQLIRKGIGYLPQEPSLFTGLSVYQNLRIVSSISKEKTNFEKRLNNLITKMGLEEIRDTLAENLSGGEKRRLEVARSLLTNPKYILLDEPFSQIDPKTVYELVEIIKKMKEENIGILITDHYAREVFSICDRIYIIADGKIIVHGTPSELKNNPMVKDVYLGQLFDL
ncbi:MAG: LPS export ABC transporter ATP-binding protein [Deltaproteobacteria bacterium]|nr:LPS export ABC transporter ATP-binding protein [Deltaproteobacteria bacterium]